MGTFFVLGVIFSFKRRVNIASSCTMIGVCLFIIYFGLITKKPINTNVKNKKYYLSIPDSPHVEHPTLELDLISGDTAYFNWYWKKNNSIE
jgi:hypothetical protein